MGEILERSHAPTRHRFDVNTYYRMAEAGVLGDPRHVELIDGEVIDTAAIGSPHARSPTSLLVFSPAPCAPRLLSSMYGARFASTPIASPNQTF